MASGDSATEKAAAGWATAAQYRIRAERADRVAENWARGAQGEVALARVIAPLAADGYYCLADRRFPGSGGNLDHLLVGPAGVFLVDAKSWTGAVGVEGKSLRQNGRRRDSHVERLRAQAIEVAGVLEDVMGKHRPLVRPAMCFVDAQIAGPTALDRVHLLNSDDLVAFVRSFPRAVDQQTLDEVMVALLERLPARTAEIHPRTGSQQPAPDPDEPVVFLQPWARYGRRRMYVKAADGSEIGYLDLVTGEVNATNETWTHALALLLPHFVSETTGAQTEELSREARGRFRRFLDLVLGRQQQETGPPVLAAYHWKKYGKERLYLHRIESTGAKRELGWVDLHTGAIRTPEPAATQLLAYCHERFQACVAPARPAPDSTAKGVP